VLSYNSIRIFSVVAFLIVAFGADAQQRCGIVEYHQKLRSTKIFPEAAEQFESWIAKKLKDQPSYGAGRIKTGPYKIPVVFHIIHNGEPVGTGANIPDEQVYSQLRVLNEDFKRLNADTTQTPAEFKPFAARLDIEFVLARRDPEGLATTGIDRADGHQASWSATDPSLKAVSYWPSEDYMNVWVASISDFLGLAQFPESSLPGLEDSPDIAQTDGIVISHRAFGSIDDGDFALDADYNKGRTLTHEMGHFFGLKHIWGDVDDCSGTDYVSDTPNQQGYTSGCPNHPHKTCDPPIISMFQNFLDYTDDRCMNLFTQGQVNRMTIVIENSPRRTSLLTSIALNDPEPVNNDLGLRRVSSPSSQCSNTFTPSVVLKNYGKNNATSAQVSISVNGQQVQVKTFSFNVTPLDSVNVSFDPVSLGTGVSGLKFKLLKTNGVVDADTLSNHSTISSSVYIPSQTNAPFSESFTNLSPDWYIQNPDKLITWQIMDVPDQGKINEALSLRFFDYKNHAGAHDVLYTPVFDLSNTQSSYLYFDVSNARFNSSNDELKVVAVTNCQNVNDGVVIYDSKGAGLATARPTQTFFTPRNAQEWRTEKLSLDLFNGQQFVQLAFVGVNGYGNNLFLDNVTIATDDYTDVRIKNIESDTIVSCEKTINVTAVIENTGATQVNTVTLNTGSSDSQQSLSLTGLALAPGDKKTVMVSKSQTFIEGINHYSVTVADVNGVIDDNAENNSKQIDFSVNSTVDRIPLRQTFDNTSETPWTIVNPNAGLNWQITSTNFGNSAYFDVFSDPANGDESWLISPVIDFSKYEAASMIFDVSYRQSDRREGFRIMASTDCGQTFTKLNYSLPATPKVTSPWLPDSTKDWFLEQYIDLNQFAGKSNTRFAFVVTNQQGNNIYLDNIEFYTTKSITPFTIEKNYTVFGYDATNPAQSKLKIAFRLDERSDVTCLIVNTVGKTMTTVLWPDVLNQTFEIPVTELVDTGVYFVRLNIGGKYSGSKIFFQK
jgi:hypothetical protein